MQYSMSDRQEHVSDTGAGRDPERKGAHTRLSEDQQVPVGLDNPFWKPEREKRSL